MRHSRNTNIWLGHTRLGLDARRDDKRPQGLYCWSDAFCLLVRFGQGLNFDELPPLRHPRYALQETDLGEHLLGRCSHGYLPHYLMDPMSVSFSSLWLVPAPQTWTTVTEYVKQTDFEQASIELLDSLR